MVKKLSNKYIFVSSILLKTNDFKFFCLKYNQTRALIRSNEIPTYCKLKDYLIKFSEIQLISLVDNELKVNNKEY